MQKTNQKKDKIYYTMGEVSEMFDVNQSLLRYWEHEFDILKPHRNKKGNRLFTPKDVETVRIIYHLVKERQMKIEIARQYIKTHREDARFEAELTERLMNIKSLLLEIKYDLLDEGETVEELHTDMSENSADMLIPDMESKEIQYELPEDMEDTPDKEQKLPVDETLQESRPAFEEQMLFDIAVPMELLQKDAEIIDNGYESAKAGFEGQSLDTDTEKETEMPSNKKAVEQTLF